jgi:tRNA threonylcarbamoyladenosine biosynthesis protein TsaB
MKILAFDTSSTACSLALQIDNEVKCLDQNAPMQQAKLILPLIQGLLAQSSLSLNELDAIAYGCGPGSFTGIRIANSVAQGIGFAAQKPIIQISSLAALAQTAYQEKKCSKVLAALDARMQQVYWGVYEFNQNDGIMDCLGEEKLCYASEVSLPDKIDQDWQGVGDAWANYTDNFIARLGLRPREIHASLLPNAQAILALAKVKFEKSQWISSADALPSYLR